MTYVDETQTRQWREGYKVDAYLITYVNGVETGREKVSSDTYPAKADTVCTWRDPTGGNVKTTLGCIRRADEDFHMIQPGDCIGVGVSAREGQLLLLRALALYRYVRHHDFTMTALMLTMGREKPDTSAIEALCRELDVLLSSATPRFTRFSLNGARTPIPARCAPRCAGHAVRHVHGQGPEQAGAGPPPGGCAGDAHDERDLRGALHTFHPCSYMSRSNLTVIRPLIYVPEKHVIHMRRELTCPCSKIPARPTATPSARR